jgi:hypothetical protein
MQMNHDPAHAFCYEPSVENFASPRQESPRRDEEEDSYEQLMEDLNLIDGAERESQEQEEDSPFESEDEEHLGFDDLLRSSGH